MSIKTNLKEFLEQVNISGRKLSEELGNASSWWGTATDSAIEKALPEIKELFPRMNEDFILTGKGNPMLEDEECEFADWSWEQYYEKLVNAYKHNGVALAERIALLDEAHEIFSQHDLIEEIPVPIRTCLAGITKRMPAMSGYNPETDWYLFGSNQRRQYYVNAIKEQENIDLNQDQLADIRNAIDWIPLEGDVTKIRYDRYYSIFKKYWKNSLSTASRLLAIKRPDHFMQVNETNKALLMDYLGIDDDISWDSYWEVMHDRIHNMRWYKEAETVTPRGSFEAKCIKYRVALLDCITENVNY